MGGWVGLQDTTIVNINELRLWSQFRLISQICHGDRRKLDIPPRLCVKEPSVLGLRFRDIGPRTGPWCSSCSIYQRTPVIPVRSQQYTGVSVTIHLSARQSFSPRWSPSLYISITQPKKTKSSKEFSLTATLWARWWRDARKNFRDTFKVWQNSWFIHSSNIIAMSGLPKQTEPTSFFNAHSENVSLSQMTTWGLRDLEYSYIFKYDDSFFPMLTLSLHLFTQSFCCKIRVYFEHYERRHTSPRTRSPVSASLE